jgi:flagellin-like protein
MRRPQTAQGVARKGISPLVATVLLVAITMTIAGLLAYWAASFAKTSLPEVNATEAQCRFASFKIYSCTHLNSTGTLNLILENQKEIELDDLTVYLIFANTSVSDGIPLNKTLTGGALKSFSLSNVPEFSKISVKTNCPDVYDEKTCVVS